MGVGVQEVLADQLGRRLRDQAMLELPCEAHSEITSMDLGHLLHVWGTWRDRQVPRHPRTVHCSKELRESEGGKRHATVLDAVVRKIEAGEDLTPHLSRNTRVAYVPSATITKGKEHLREDRDPLLSDWGIHHLHLSTRPGRNGLVERTKDLLFAIFRRDDAYLIGIYPHARWAPREALEIVVRNWPDAGLMMGSLAGARLTQSFDDDDRLALRNVGMTVPVEIDGAVYTPRGQTLDHAPLEVTRRVMALRHELNRLRAGHHDAVLAEWEAWWDARFGRPVLPSWRAAIKEDEAGVMREACFFGLARLP